MAITKHQKELFHCIVVLNCTMQKPVLCPTQNDDHYQNIRTLGQFIFLHSKLKSFRNLNITFSVLSEMTRTMLGYNVHNKLFKTCIVCFHGYSARCQKSMNHENDESAEHQSDGRCHYQAQYDNRIFTCRVSCTESFPLVSFSYRSKGKKPWKVLPMRLLRSQIWGKFSAISQLLVKTFHITPEEFEKGSFTSHH